MTRNDKGMCPEKRTLMVRCPVCGARREYAGNPYRPFCSRHCKDLDFHQWSSEGYRIQGEEPVDDEDEDEQL